MTKMNKSLIILFFLIVPLISVFSKASVVEADVTPFSLLYETIGSVNMVNEGVGISGYDPAIGATLTGYDIPGPVVKAYLLWQGSDYDSQDVGDDVVDENVFLAIDGGTAIAIAADSARTHFHVQEDEPTRHHYSYLADVTSIVLQGSHNYTFSGFDMAELEYGFGIFAIYDTGGAQLFHIQVLEGLDRFWTDEPNHTEGEVHCIDFDPVGVPRDVDLDMIAASVGLNRDNQIYYQTGTGTKPTDLQVTGALLENQPFGQYDGADWDSYEQDTALVLPANDAWACVQVTINEGTAIGRPASGLIQLVSMAVPTTGPTAVTLQNVQANITTTSATLIVGIIGFLVLAVVSLRIVFSRRTR